MQKISSIVINDKIKIKTQLQVSYSIIVLFSSFVTLGICFLLLHSLGTSINKTAENKISKQTIESVVAVSVEKSNSAMQQVKITSENVVMNSVLYASILINYSNISSVHGPLLAPIPTYRDYNFVPGCTSPKCPSDIQYFPSSLAPKKYAYTSIHHSSIYLYSEKYQQAVRNDSMWDLVVTESPEIMNVVDGLAFQDTDDLINFSIGLQQGISVLFYHTARIENLKTGLTNVVHRSFPGTKIDETITGDPSQSDWFLNAPINAVYLTGPYMQVATQQMVYLMSSRKTIYFPAGTHDQLITFVSVGMLSLFRGGGTAKTDFGGFTVLMNCETHQIISWNGEYHTVESAKSFLRDYDPILADKVDAFTVEERQHQQTIEYTDSAGILWLVSYVPYFTSQRFGTDTPYNALALLTFTQVKLANAPLYELTALVTFDLRRIVGVGWIIVSITAGLVFVLVFCTVHYITSPLPKLIVVANEIIKMSTASEEDKDFSGILSDPLFALKREDEIGLLIGDYYQLQTMLQERSEANRDTSQYPENVFQVLEDDEPSTQSSSSTRAPQPFERTWEWFTNKMLLNLDEDQRLAFVQCTEKRPRQKKSLLKGHKLSSIQELDEMSKKHNTIKKQPVIRIKTLLQKMSSNRVLPTIRQSGEFDVILEVDDVSESVDLEDSNRPRFDSLILSGDSSDRQQFSGGYEVISPSESQDSSQFSFDSEKHHLSIVLPLDTLEVTQAASVDVKISSVKYSKHIKQTRNAVVTTRSSIRTKLVSLFVILLVGCVLTMMWTVARVNRYGKKWSNSSKTEVSNVVINNLQSIATGKAAYILVYFIQMTTDAYTNGVSFQSILLGVTLRPNWYYNNDLNLPSHATDLSNPYSVGGIVGTTNYSGYNGPGLAKCWETSNNCASGQYGLTTRITSIMDMKFRSLFRYGTSLYSMQTALESDGLVRRLPYQQLQGTGDPSECYIQDQTAPHCAASFANSSCTATWVNPANPSVKNYPPYDSRCRSWYQKAIKNSKETKNTVLYSTYISTDNCYMLTASSAQWAGGTVGGYMLGVVSSAYFIQDMAKSITSLEYMSEGYCYLVQGSDPSEVVIHPRTTLNCSTLMCLEGFSASEFVAFQEQILTPLAYLQDVNITTTYMKNGRQWQLVFSRVVYTNTNFILIATLPVDVIIETSTAIGDSIGNTIVELLLAFIAVIVVLVAITSIFAQQLINSIVNPINELRDVFELVRMSEDLSGQVPEIASSSDMRVMLDAFSKMMVAMRFANESYTDGNRKRAHEAFTDALSLYTDKKDKRGIGASLANLAASELARQRYDAAESLFKMSIENAEEILTTHILSNKADEVKMERTLSDRRASLASVYLQCDQLEKAMTMLTPALERDVQIGYLIGYALKQCHLGKYHVTKGEFVAAETLFIDCLKFIRLCGVKIITGVATPMSPVVKTRICREEIESAEQIMLHKLAQLKSERGVSLVGIESAVLHALTKNNVMHADYTIKSLILLKKVFASENRKKHIMQLQWLASEYNLNITRKNNSGEFVTNFTNNHAPKRVMFCLDNSARMLGAAFQSTMDNVNTAFEHHVNTGDSLSILYFNGRLDFALPLTAKATNELLILDRIERLQNPRGSDVAMYDAVIISLYELSQLSTAEDWLILVTSSNDNASRLSLEKTVDKVIYSKVGLIVIGIGDHVQTAALELLATSTDRGVYFHANADKKSINEAFEHAIQIIEMSGNIELIE